MAPSFVRRDGSTERGDVVQVPQKRPRPVLSCVECRRKKLKCDRLLPCEQCRKAYQSAQCTYTTRPGLQSQNAHQTDNSRPEGGQMGRESAEHTESPAASHEIASSSLPADDTTPTRIVKKKVGVIEDLQSRVHHLERLLLNDQSRFSVSALEHGGNLVEQNNHSSLKNPGVLSVKGSRSRYHGLNHKMTLLHQVSPMMISGSLADGEGAHGLMVLIGTVRGGQRLHPEELQRSKHDGHRKRASALAKIFRKESRDNYWLASS